MKSNENYDGQIYLRKEDLPEINPLRESVEFEAEESHPIAFILDSDNLKSQAIYERRLARWKDITTPPQVRNKCVRMCEVWPVKFCCGWKLQTKWLYKTATLRVSTKSPSDIKGAIEQCLLTAAIAAAVTAIISGGSTAAAVAERLFTTCLREKLGDNLISVKIDLRSVWGSWS